MPKEYIECEAAIEAAKHAWAKGIDPVQYMEIIPAADNDCDFDMDTPFCPWCGSQMVEEKVRENIKDAPTAAVVEVRHGQWIRKEDDSCYWYECSECGEKLAKTQWGNDYFSAYCPNCGTLMDKEEQ